MTKAAIAQMLALTRFSLRVLLGALAAPSEVEASPSGAPWPAGEGEVRELKLPDAEIDGKGIELLELPEPRLVALPLGCGLLSSFKLLSTLKRVLLSLLA